MSFCLMSHCPKGLLSHYPGVLLSHCLAALMSYTVLVSSYVYSLVSYCHRYPASDLADLDIYHLTILVSELLSNTLSHCLNVLLS